MGRGVPPGSMAGAASLPLALPLYPLLAFVLAVAYGTTLAGLPVEAFSDRVNYLNYAENSWGILQNYWQQGFLAVVANEPLWLITNGALSSVLDTDSVVRVIIFTSATLVAWLTLWHSPRHFAWLLVFLLLPQVINNHIVHLRQGAAVAVFLSGWFASRAPLRWLLMGMAPFIHAAFAFLILLLGITHGARKLRLGPDLRVLLFALAGLGIGATLGWIASLVGARQVAYYDFVMPDVSGLGFLFWASILIVMALQGWTFLRQHAFEIGLLVFYLSTYFLVEVTARIFESGLLLLLLAGLRLTSWRRLLFLSAVSLYVAFQYAARWGQPWLGFGA